MNIQQSVLFYIFFILLVLLSPELSSQSVDTEYSIIAHSHNDYSHDSPITKALNYGFMSLEVDIIHDGERIKVSHDDKDLHKKGSFEESYLIPLLKELKENDKQILLLVDIKEFNDSLFNDLNRIILKYKDEFVCRNKSKNPKGRIKAVLSGEIPRKEIIQNEKNEYLFIDGRVGNLKLGYDADVMPIISADISDHVAWRGQSPPNKMTIKKLKELINRVHEDGHLVRFWKTGETAIMWNTLIQLGVDIIGVDNVESFYLAMKENGHVIK